MESDGIVTVNGPILGQGEVCKAILLALPEWFGIEEATQQYIRDINELPTFLAWVAGQVVGFMSVKRHNTYAAELYVLGIYPDMHRRSIGRALFIAVEAYLSQQSVEYVQVKTLSDSHPDEGYAKTRAFYHAMGFRPLEEFKTLWGADNPCLLMVKGI